MTPAAARASHARLIGAVGETVTVRRYSGTGVGRTKVDVNVRARVVEFERDVLIGTVVQSTSELIALAEDLESSAITLPLRVGDKVVVRGKEMNVEAPDDNTRRLGGTLVAINIKAKG